MRSFALGAALGAALAAALAAGTAVACGPDFPRAEFLSGDRPEAPDSAYARGRLGLVFPAFSTRNLVIAYRALAGLGGSDAALVGPRAAAGVPRPAPGDTNWVEAWRRARAVSGRELPQDLRFFMPTERTLRRGDRWFSYVNCQDDAFRAATRTLADRLAREGGLTPAVQDWIAGQDSVFANCGFESTLVLPPPAPSGAPAWLVQDRAYQRAAARFYGGDFDAAAAAFDRIAQDAASPYRGLAAYLAARAETRRGTCLPAPGEVDAASLRGAAARVDRILADARLSDLHEAARRLRSFLDFRLDRATQLTALSAALSAPALDAEAPGRIVDLAKLLTWFTPAQIESLAAGDPALDLADWIASVRGGPERAAHALARFHASHSTRWLVAAMLDAGGADAATAELQAAAAQAPRASPAYETLTLQRVRLHLARGETAYARALLEACQADGPGRWSRSAWNEIAALHGALARNLAEFTADAPRLPVRAGYAFEADSARAAEALAAGPLLDGDGAYVLSERLPLAALGRLADDASLPRRVRRELALVAWTRATVLDRADDVARLDPVLARLWPELDSSFVAYRAARDPAARRFEAAWWVLTHPGCDTRVRAGLGRPDPPAVRSAFGDNWWAPWDSLPSTSGLGPDAIDALPWAGDWGTVLPALADRIVPAEDRAAAQRERDGLRRMGPGANWLCERTLAEVRRNPRDPRLPEALHRCVQATRSLTPDARTHDWSRRAFTALHRQYGDTEWARRTRYYY